ncbi:MAG TPA: hypothetical protein PK514_07215 [Spirochaetota bacterium]|nr:hypothetical protein [Spirochaetota bacterium]
MKLLITYNDKKQLFLCSEMRFSGNIRASSILSTDYHAIVKSPLRKK